MLNHISIGVRDIAKARRFYDAALKPLGYKCLNEAPGSLGYGRDAVALWIGTAEHPVPADDKSGLHFCFDAPTRKSVAAFHAAGVKREAVTTANRGCAKTTAPIITRPSSSIPTATGSKPTAAPTYRPPSDLERSIGDRHMASIRREIVIEARPADVWDAIRDVGAVHTRLAPGFVTDTKMDGDARIVTFGNGLVARELIVDVERRRAAARRGRWWAGGSPITMHRCRCLRTAMRTVAPCGSPICCPTILPAPSPA